MIRLINGSYICRLNHHELKIIYKGNNECEIYLRGEFQGRANFDYVKMKLNSIEKRWDTMNIKKYQYKELTSEFDVTI
ncbi:hypothetical protein JYA63_06835 [Fictibacillus nanhaiensis]|uniref:Uncharacterized protein n=1 Tax=Fictibacillus nanhaiensis TaxID=742169 RepID=A0ABS2ZP71_9BACL|nr:hypothetical protein [Fictibacillus nanhaiensis]